MFETKKSSLRTLQTADGLNTIETQEGSQVIQVTPSNVFDLNSTNTAPYRSCHLVSFKPITRTYLSDDGVEDEYLGPFQLTFELAGYIAAKHLNERNSSIVPNLHERMEGCDIQFTYEMSDTGAKPLQALSTLQQVMTREHSYETPQPTALIGAASSKISLALATLAGVYQVPQVSGTSSAPLLDDKTKAPYFSRMYPTDSADAQALVIYLKSLGVTHFGCIYGRDTYGTGFGLEVTAAANAYGLTVYSTAYEVNSAESLIGGLEYLKSTDVRYFFGVFHHESWKVAFRTAYDIGIMGHSGFAWYLSDNNSELTTDEFRLDAETEGDIAKAINGVGVILPGFPLNPTLSKVLAEDFASDKDLQRAYADAHRDPNVQRLFEDYDFAGTPMLPSFYGDLVYDSVITVGLSACEQKERFFTSEQLLTTIRDQQFQGASGLVTVNNVTGTRELLRLRYTITNVKLPTIGESNAADGQIRFESEEAIAVEFPDAVLQIGSPYMYADGTTVAPPALPLLEIKMNHIPQAVRVIGLSLAALVVAASIGCAVFAFMFRKKGAVRAAQPQFLYLICSGCLIMALSIIPMSLQEPTSESGLDIACMSTLYLVSIGFVLCFSALFCKLYRLNKLLKEAENFRRVTVEFKDVLYPLIILMSINLIILVTWSIVDPLQWTRNPSGSSVDGFGRVDETYATCSSNDKTTETLFYMAFFLVNISALIAANVESYKGRNVPSQFNEISRMARSMFIVLEATIVGFPVLFLVQDQPTANFTVRSVLLLLVCLAILGPIFVPLWLYRNMKEKRRQTVFSQSLQHTGASSSFNMGRRGSSKYFQKGDGGSSAFCIRHSSSNFLQKGDSSSLKRFPEPSLQSYQEEEVE